MTHQFRPEHIARVLFKHHVDCVVVGGIGAQIHGATRGTQDFDLVASFERDNLRRLAGAMRELGAHLRTDAELDEVTIQATKALVHEGFLERMMSTTLWHTDAGDFDVLRAMPDADGALQGYEQLIDRSEDRRYAGVVVHVASLEDIVNSKVHANRDKDRQALPELRELLERPRSAQPASPGHEGLGQG